MSPACIGTALDILDKILQTPDEDPFSGVLDAANDLKNTLLVSRFKLFTFKKFFFKK
jgi:hypothetical protein